MAENKYWVQHASAYLQCKIALANARIALNKARDQYETLEEQEKRLRHDFALHLVDRQTRILINQSGTDALVVTRQGDGVGWYATDIVEIETAEEE